MNKQPILSDTHGEAQELQATVRVTDTPEALEGVRCPYFDSNNNICQREIRHRGKHRITGDLNE